MQQQLQEETEQSAQREYAQVDRQRQQYAIYTGRAAQCCRRNGDRDGVGYEAHNIVKRDNLEQCVDKLAPCVCLSNGHNGRSRSGSSCQRRQYE